VRRDRPEESYALAGAAEGGRGAGPRLPEKLERVRAIMVYKAPGKELAKLKRR
jgi:hypothetical protein